MNAESSAQQLLQDLCRRDTRYPFEAYEFLYAALGYVQHERRKQGLIKEDSEDKDKHLTGQQLAEGYKDLAVQEFGMLAPTVFKAWNIQKTDDIGRMVYNLIDINLMSKTENDKLDDFSNVYDIPKALLQDFRIRLE
jgi:uncharacterized repeat protein (TIGR04138 family)